MPAAPVGVRGEECGGGEGEGRGAGRAPVSTAGRGLIIRFLFEVAGISSGYCRTPPRSRRAAYKTFTRQLMCSLTTLQLDSAPLAEE